MLPLSASRLDSSRIPARAVTKTRSQTSLAAPSSQLLSIQPQRRRLYSEPIRVLEQQGIVKCDCISIEEAWNRFAIRRDGNPPVPTAGYRLPVEESISPRSKPSRPPPLFAKQVGQMLPKPPLLHERTKIAVPVASFMTVAAASRRANYSKQPKRTQPPAPVDVETVQQHLKECCSTCTVPSVFQTYSQDGSVKEISHTLQSYQLPQRKESARSKSSYGSAPSWVSGTAPASSVETSDSFLARLEDSTLTRTVEVPRLSARSERQTGMPRWRGTRSKKIELQRVQEREELQCQLGRPTDSNDSPYSICRQLQAQERKTKQAPVESITPPPRMVPPLVEKRIRRARLVVRNVGEEVQDDRGGASTGGGSSSITTTSNSSDDEAHILWKNLETTLGVKLGCEPSKRGGRGEARVAGWSRIPRIQSSNQPQAAAPIARTVVAPPAKQSRLPVRSKRGQQGCETNVVRKTSLVSLTLQLLRSQSTTSSASSKSLASGQHLGLLPQSIKQRREEAIQRQCWSQRLLMGSLQ